ncbi:saccharopine dehydrogenase NADP-binding domain-containing protein [Aestuariibacter halophilus]|uniref:Saccharopine dehydrogenase NADP-binding domain-containing protein n=1 Tax=Fluctibacter halophilus TaxID=226011 RepID=A0ABS8G986_9ALTE|nr:saccharopine dehydrogenase NADP-binding domain-containing protein [Aestuariibacter halophilus]MCC2616284.1 saccharopine dehydrogenase NADP-binding domain-containing protein [Aestuariibacter halophilus]
MSKHDIVLYGATSFVGQITADYLVQQLSTQPELRLAFAGRNMDKLESLKKQLGEKANPVTLLHADATDNDSIHSMCNATHVVISTVGPYALYGEPVVKACASLGTDYCDLTGEPQWIHRMLARYESVAKLSGARIVHSCGFDSIPSDLGVYFLQQQAQQEHQQPCSTIAMRVRRLKGGASGGTVASMLQLIEEVSRSPALRKVIANPYALCPDGHGFTVRQDNLHSAKYDRRFKSWMAPFVMAAINTRIVHRSNALLQNAYTDHFRYDEAMLTGHDMSGRMRAYSMTAVLGGIMLAGRFKLSRDMLANWILPKPGEGPSPREQENGYYDLRFIGQTDDNHTVSVKVYGDRDPGYGSTAKMLGQAALCLRFDIADKEGGFWTPASAFGQDLITRLEQHAGLQFTVE